MSLNTGTANALGTAIATALNPSAPDTAHWQTICQQIYTALLNDIRIQINAGVIVTNGGPTTQAGPPAPIAFGPL